MYTAIRKIIEAAWENRELLKKEETRSAIDQVIGLLDKGKLRTATPTHVDHDHGTIRVSR